MNYHEVSHCRICGNDNLVEVVNLGLQSLTGVFPKDADEIVETGPLELVKCHSENGCGLVQLKHSFSPEKMYGENYGYRSGLNGSMVNHLKAKVAKIAALTDLKPDNIVLDIGSNDGTTLSFYDKSLKRVGIDPTAEKFAKYYEPGIQRLADFFTADLFLHQFPNQKATVVTSFSMFYDLENPVIFAKEVERILADDGIWVFEQSYLPTMIEKNSYDTICHEHIEYYALKQINWIMHEVGLKIVDIEFNEVNGGSFSVVAAKKESKYAEFADLLCLLNNERDSGYDDLETYFSFNKRIMENAANIQDFIRDKTESGQSIAFLGASTKGNVILQYCKISASDVVGVADVNPEKFGRFTPGTMIPIISEEFLLENEPDYVIVLIWHFREFLEKQLNLKKAKLVFPLPELSEK